MAFPFTALCGQEEMKLALLLLAVNPGLKGVLLWGEKGTAKSTAARAFANLTEGPFVNLPLAVTEEALLGGPDLKALLKGKKSFLPGLIPRADGGVLYVDEVNLLPRPLLNLLLDVLETGLLTVEREGFSQTMRTKFVLIGSMNPEEGSLPPQLLDRFGLCVKVEAVRDPALRAEIIKRRLAYEKDPQTFEETYAEREARLREKILEARGRLFRVKVPERILGLISLINQEARVAGHRGDLMLFEAVRALAAWEGKETVGLEEVERVKELVLRHRRRKEEKPPKKKKIPKETPQSKAKPQKRLPQTPEPEKRPQEEAKREEKGNEPSLSLKGAPGKGKEVRDKVFPVGEVFRPRDFDEPLKPGKEALRLGRRGKAYTLDGPGYYLRPVPYQGKGQLALLPTLISAALRRPPRGGRLEIRPEDLKAKLKLTRTARLLIFCVDGSGSMAAEARMKEAKGAIMSLLLSAYQKRDLAALMVFRDKEARLVLPPTSSVEFAGRLLTHLPVGGSTPLPHALKALKDFLEKRLRLRPEEEVSVILITDGRGNVSLTGRPPKEEIEALALELKASFPTVQFVVIDTETGPVRLEMAKGLAKLLGASYFTPEALRAENLVQIAQHLNQGERP